MMNNGWENQGLNPLQELPEAAIHASFILDMQNSVQDL